MSVAGSISAAATLYFTGGNVQAAMAAYSIGSGVEAMVNAPDTYGPRLEDLQVQMSSYGAPIPYEWGVNRHAGTIIWPQVIEAKENEQSESAKGGPDNVSYTYSLSFAVLISATKIAGVQQIWANKKLVYDASPGNTGPMKDPALGAFRLYLGTEDQEVDPLIEATDGPSPAYLGLAYIVFEDYDVTDTQGRPPQMEFKVITEGDASQAPPVRLGNGGMTTLYTNPSTGESTLWSVSGTSVYVYSLPDGELIQTITLPAAGFSITSIVGEIWVGHSQSVFDAYGKGATPINPVTYALNASVNFGYSGAISKLGTVVANGLVLYAFVNNGVGSGARMYPTNTASGITVPDWVYASLEMPSIFKAALAGFGNWVTIADFATDTTAATIYNPDWAGTVQGHRFAHDATRNFLYWANVGSSGVYRVDLAVYTIEKLINVAGVQGMHYNTADDTIYVDTQTGLNAYSPESGALTGTIASAGPLVGQARGTAIDVGSAEYYYVSEAGSPGSLWKINLKGALTPAKIPLSKIVGDICTMKGGLLPEQVDVTTLTPLVDGYPLSRQMTRRAGIEALQPIYSFDAVENDAKLQFVMRGGAVAATISEEDRSAREFGADLPDSLTIVRAQDLELPFEVELEYPDVDADHLVGAQYSRRITKDTKQKVNLQTAVVMPAEKGKSVTAVNLYEAWLQTTFRWTTTRKYSHLLPTDVVELPTKEALYRARITMKREQPNGIIEWEGKQEAADVYTLTGAGAAPTNYVTQSIFSPGRTVLELMDIPLLRDQDAGKGFPVAMAGTSASWPGAQLFKSSDGGSSYATLFSQSGAAVIGRATTVLGDFTAGDIFDEGNAVTVTIQPGGQLVSYSESQLLDGTSAFALGVNGRWEIVQYRTATLIAPLTYTLTGLLRGRRGTEWAAGTHQLGDRFIMLNAGGVQFYDPGAADVNVERLYKAPAFRAALSAATAVPFTDTLVRLRPYSVANLKVEDTGSGYTITWAHRSILGGGWRDGGDVPLDATFVAFDITISKLDGTQVKIYSVTEESFFYTDEQILVDFGSVPADFNVRVAQRNSDYGQGVGVTVAASSATLGYDVPPVNTGGGGVAPGTLDPEPDLPATDAWKFEGRLDERIFQQYYSYINNFTHATATHVFLFGGSTHVYVPGGVSNPANNPNVYIFDRAAKTFTEFNNGQVSGYGFEMNAGVVGSKHYFVDGRPPVRTTVLGTRTVVCNDFSNPAAPARSAYQSANEMVAEFMPKATTNFGRMCNGKIWFPSSGSVFDPVANTWATMPLPPVECRYRPLLGSVGTKLYFLGGTTTVTEPYSDINPGPVQNMPYDGTYKKEVWVFDTVAATWARKADLPYAIASHMVRWSTANDPNFGATFNVEGLNGKLYVFDSNGQILIYNEATDTWASKANRISYRMFVSTSVLNDSIWMSTHIGIPKSYGPQKANQDLADNLNAFELAQRLVFRYTPSLDA